MRLHTLRTILLSIALSAAIAVTGAARADTPDAQTGAAAKLTGQYLEVCGCERVCESALAEAGRRGACAFVAALKIEAGQRGSVTLAGIGAALVAPAPGDEGGRGSAPVLYVDRSATPAQAEALRAALGERLAARAGVASLPPPRAAAVRLGRTSEALTLEIDGVAQVRARPIHGGFRQPVQLSHAPGATIPFPCLARGVAGQVADAAARVRFDALGRSVLYGKFDFATARGRR
jgi:hypothetical protein